MNKLFFYQMRYRVLYLSMIKFYNQPMLIFRRSLAWFGYYLKNMNHQQKAVDQLGKSVIGFAREIMPLLDARWENLFIHFASQDMPLLLDTEKLRQDRLMQRDLIFLRAAADIRSVYRRLIPKADQRYTPIILASLIGRTNPKLALAWFKSNYHSGEVCVSDMNIWNALNAKYPHVELLRVYLLNNDITEEQYQLLHQAVLPMDTGEKVEIVKHREFDLKNLATPGYGKNARYFVLSDPGYFEGHHNINGYNQRFGQITYTSNDIL